MMPSTTISTIKCNLPPFGNYCQTQMFHGTSVMGNMKEISLGHHFPVSMLKYTVYQPLYKHLTTECCNRPNRINYPREPHNQLCMNVSEDRRDFMVLYKRVSTLYSQNIRSTCYSSQNKRTQNL